MAVDYIHRLVVIGPPAAVRRFRRGVTRAVTRRLDDRSWRERVSLSFEAMYTLCPALSRVSAEPPGDPYDIAAWPTDRSGRRARARYQFHTRNMTFAPFLRRLSTRFPALVLCLVTFCLDDSVERWFNRPVERDLDTEREIFLTELALEEQGLKKIC